MDKLLSGGLAYLVSRFLMPLNKRLIQTINPITDRLLQRIKIDAKEKIPCTII
nr:hypothetical protein [uncultured Desulfobacter sp.]